MGDIVTTPSRATSRKCGHIQRTLLTRPNTAFVLDSGKENGHRFARVWDTVSQGGVTQMGMALTNLQNWKKVRRWTGRMRASKRGWAGLNSCKSRPAHHLQRGRWNKRRKAPVFQCFSSVALWPTIIPGTPGESLPPQYQPPPYRLRRCSTRYHRAKHRSNQGGTFRCPPWLPLASLAARSILSPVDPASLQIGPEFLGSEVRHVARPPPIEIPAETGP